MAFGKKKSTEDAPAPASAAAGLDVAAAPEGAIDSEMFASASPAATEDEGAPDATAEGATTEAAAEEPATAAPEGGADPLAGGPDLLSMFQTTAIEADDKSALLELAGEVELDDLLEDLQTVAAALSSRRSR
jgi:hypothetical protein